MAAIVLEMTMQYRHPLHTLLAYALSSLLLTAVPCLAQDSAISEDTAEEEASKETIPAPQRLDINELSTHGQQLKP